jgi:hypothetical protein
MRMAQVWTVNVVIFVAMNRRAAALPFPYPSVRLTSLRFSGAVPSRATSRTRPWYR